MNTTNTDHIAHWVDYPQQRSQKKVKKTRILYFIVALKAGAAHFVKTLQTAFNNFYNLLQQFLLTLVFNEENIDHLVNAYLPCFYSGCLCEHT
jgi:hypothetical protein